MATQPPPAPRKTRRSKTVLSPVPMEIPDGAIMVHSNDSTIAVPSHGGDSRHLTDDHEFPPTGTRKSKTLTGEGRGSGCQGNPGGKGHTVYGPRKDNPTEKRWRFKFRRGWRLLDVRPPWWKK